MAKKLKSTRVILFAIRNISYLPYYQTIIISLLKKGYVLKLLYSPNWSKKESHDKLLYLKRKYSNFDFGSAYIRNDFLRWVIFTTRELRSYRRYLLDKKQSVYYQKRWSSYLIQPFRFLSSYNFFKNMLKNSFFEFSFKMIENITPPEKKIITQLNSIKPSLVIVAPANMRFSEEMEYLKAAKKLSIPVVLPVISWDNLTTKGLIHIQPDLLLCWNNEQLKDAVNIHKISKSKIKITGSPFFDKWFNNFKPSSRHLFCKENGLKPNNVKLLYLGSTKNIAENESWLIDDLLNYLKNSKNDLIRNLEVIIRPHPSNARIFDKFNGEPNIKVIPKSGDLATSQKELKLFYNCVYHSVAIIGINTSAMIDAICMNKPVMAMMTEKYKNTQMDTTHFKQLLKFSVIDKVYSSEDLINRLILLIRGKDNKASQRNIFIKKFIRPFGINKSAGDVASLEITNLIK